MSKALEASQRSIESLTVQHSEALKHAKEEHAKMLEFYTDGTDKVHNLVDPRPLHVTSFSFPSSCNGFGSTVN